MAEKPDELLETTSSYIKRFPQCGCEIVKAAIQSAKEADGSKASPKTVAAIVEAAMRAAPEDTWKQLLQCAVAAAPDSIAEIRGVVDSLAPNNPDLAAIADQSPLDPPGGGGSLMPGSSTAPPTIVNPPSVTNPNPGRRPDRPGRP